MEKLEGSKLYWSQLKATLVKNILLKKREKRRTIAEVLLPLYSLGVLILIKLCMPNPNFPSMETPTQRHASLFKDFRLWANHTIAVVPNTSEVLRFLDNVDVLWSNYQQQHAHLSHTVDTGSDNDEKKIARHHHKHNHVHAHAEKHNHKHRSLSYGPFERFKRDVTNRTEDADKIKPINWIGFDSKESMLRAYWKNPSQFPVAVLFDEFEGPIDGPLKYEIRTNPSIAETPPTTTLYSSPANCRYTTSLLINQQISELFPMELGDTCPVNQYYYSGFVALQSLLDYTKISIDTGMKNISIPNIQLLMFPKEAYTSRWIVAFRMIIPLYMVMSVSQFITYLLMLIIGEKENKIKEGMKIMGLRDSVFWLSWFIIYAVFVLWLSATCCLLIYLLNVFQHTNMFLIFILTFLYALTVIMFAFMITPFFDKSRTAGILGNFAVNIMSIFYFLQIFLGDSNSIAFWMISLVSSSGYALAMDKALVLDLKGEGITFGNIWSTDPEGGMPFAGSMIMMVVDIVLYGALAYYFDSVIPSEHGIKRSPIFCFKPSYWCPPKNLNQNQNQPNQNQAKSISLDTLKRSKQGSLREDTKLINGSSMVSVNGNGTTSDCVNGDANGDVEPVAREMKGKEAIRIVDLCKSFKKGKQKAVNGIDLTIYEGQITAILGHNGAGKTTLFNMLTGLTKPTSGTAYIFGYDIRDPNDMDRVRAITGVCPQHDILFDCLTAREHLQFFAAVKGIHPKIRNHEVTKTLKDVDLIASADTPSRYLSGGQKRKLSVGIAVIGDPKIIILDEPTAGVDPYSRRHMWSVLQNRRHGKVILLTTHFMDEADILADRKAVVSKGKVRCCGSSLFLKNKFGIGYHLTLVLEGTCREHAITRLVTSHVPKAEKARRHGRELSFILPHNAVDHFATLFSAIEAEIASKTSRLGISCYGVSMTTLEEVFLHLERDAEDVAEDEEGAEPTVENVDNLSKKMVRNRALSRSLSLQSKSTSYHSLQNEPFSSGDKEDENPDLQETKDKRKLTPSGDCNGLDSIIEDKTPATPGFNNAFMNMKCSPNSFEIFFALIKLRCLRLIRDIQKLYLMVFLPLGLAALSLYGNSIQTSMEPKQKSSIMLDTTLYQNESTLVVFNQAVVDLNPFLDQFEIMGVNKLEHYDGNYSALLMLKPNMGAINIRSFPNQSLSNLDQGYRNQVGRGAGTQMAFTLIYNDTYTHSLPILINLMNNAVYRWLSDDRLTRGTWSPIETSVRQLPQTRQPEGFNLGVVSTALFMGMIFVLVPGNLAIDMVYDRQIRAKNQLRVNGLGFGLYFFSYFAVLSTLVLLIMAALLGIVILFDIPALREGPALMVLCGLVIIYCPASILYNTCLSYMFDRMDSAQALLPHIGTSVGCVPFFLVVFLDMLRIGGKAPFILHCILSILNPMYVPYAIIYYVQRVYLMCTINSACVVLTLKDYMTDEIIVMIVGTCLNIPILSLLLMLLDTLCSSGNVEEALKMFKLRKSRKSDQVEDQVDLGEHEDMDVKCERQKVAAMLRDSSQQTPPVVMVQNLHKEYSGTTCWSRVSSCCEQDTMNPTKVAIKSLSLAVDAGEVFGLLGHNGAGKTTTMKIITAEEAPSRGRVQIGGHSITSNLSDAFKVMGYCPQHDALWKNITVREHLECYATIRGVPWKHHKQVIESYLNGLQIKEHADKHAGQCSGGTRRKLSFALASIGNPKVVLMDEPSTGMDPRSKRFLWDTILASFQGARGAILTTHSMEEADALCSRVGIMVQGELRCLGSTQHLKNLYGAGYTLEVKHRGGDRTPITETPPDVNTSESASGSESSSSLDPHEDLKKFVDELFPESKLVESFADRFVFSVPQHSVPSLASCFSRLERAKQELDIVEYSFSQTTLEQVFLKFLSEEEQHNGNAAPRSEHEP